LDQSLLFFVRRRRFVKMIVALIGSRRPFHRDPSTTERLLRFAVFGFERLLQRFVSLLFKLYVLLLAAFFVSFSLGAATAPSPKS